MKKFKHLFKLLIAIILFGQTSLTVFANENITSVSDINTTEEITEVESTINENEDVTAEIEEENSDELMSMSPYNSMAFATFDGQDLSEPTNTVSYNNLQSTRTTKSLDIKAEFSGSSSVTSRQIIVELKDGLAYDVLPGMNNSGAWIFDSSTLPVNLQGIIINGTWEKPAIVQGYQPKGGKIIYELAAGTTAVNISVGIISDIAFNIGTGKTIIDGIRVASFENGVKKNEEVLELYTLTEELIIMIDSVGTASRSYLSPGGSFTFTKRFRLRDSVTPHFYANALTKKIELTYKIDKNIQLTSITSNSQAHLPNSNILIETDASNATYNLVKVTLLETDANFVNLNYNVEAISTAVDGTYPLSLVGSSVTLLDDTVVANTLVRDFEVITVAISNSTDSTLTLTNLGDSSFSYDSNLVNEKNMPLGGFYFANKTPNTALNQKVKLEFTDTNIGVTTARIAFHKDANATDIIIKTTKGQAFTIATTQGLNVLGSNVWPVKTYAIDINSLGSIDSDEYIAEVIYNMGDVPSGEYSNGTALGLAQPYPATTYASPLTYFGNIISDTVPTQFSAKATIVSADKDFSDSSAVSATSIVNVNLAKNITFTGSYSSTKATV